MKPTFKNVFGLSAILFGTFVLGMSAMHFIAYPKLQQANQHITELREKETVLLDLLQETQNYIQRQEFLINVNNGIIDILNKLYAGALTADNKKEMTLTAYTLSHDECGDDFTPALSSSACVIGHTVAVSRDLRSWMGTFIYIEGYGVRYVNDLMHSRFKNRIDLLVETKDEAFEIGKSKVNIYRF